MYLKLRSGCMPWPNLTKHINIILFNPLDKQKQRKGAVLRKKREFLQKCILKLTIQSHTTLNEILSPQTMRQCYLVNQIDTKEQFCGKKEFLQKCILKLTIQSHTTLNEILPPQTMRQCYLVNQIDTSQITLYHPHGTHISLCYSYLWQNNQSL